jgi:hypothetical protein
MPFFYKMDTRRLQASDMKKLVDILRDVPTPDDERRATRYRRCIKDEIRRLPRRLKISYLSISATNLCSMHKALDTYLMNDLWAWLRHELNGAIGKFLYPLIMSGRLTTEQELKVRQLEPVLRMWKRDFTLEKSAPPYHEPIDTGLKWHYQEDRCPACRMARIGSDEKVLFALFAGMVGRLQSKTPTPAEAQTASWEKSKSKRLRFVRYWLRNTPGGDKTVSEAGQLGVEMKRMHSKWEAEQRRLDGTAAQNMYMPEITRPLGETDRSRGTEAGQQGRRSRPADIKTTYPPPQELPAMSAHDSKLGPKARSDTAPLFSPAYKLGFDLPSMSERVAPVRQQPTVVSPVYPFSSIQVPGRESVPVRRLSNASDDTVMPDDSFSCAGLRPPPLQTRRRPPPLPTPASTVKGDIGPGVENRVDSVHSTRPPSTYVPSLADTQTILSYTGGPSSRSIRQDPLDNPIYNSIETSAQREAKIRKILTGKDPFADEEDNVSVFPTPSHGSVYEAFSNIRFDLGMFDLVDEEVPTEERGNGGKDDEENIEVKDDSGEDRQRTPRQEEWSRRDGSVAWDDLF